MFTFEIRDDTNKLVCQGSYDKNTGDNLITCDPSFNLTENEIRALGKQFQKARELYFKTASTLPDIKSKDVILIEQTLVDDDD